MRRKTGGGIGWPARASSQKCIVISRPANFGILLSALFGDNFRVFRVMWHSTPLFETLESWRGTLVTIITDDEKLQSSFFIVRA